MFLQRINEIYKDRMQHLIYWDVGFIKWAALLFGIIIAKLFPQVLAINIWWYVLFMIVCMIRPVYAFWFKK